MALITSELGTACPKCGEHTLAVTVEAAAHDPTLLDVVVTCDTAEGGCGQILNGFYPIAEMMVLA